MNVRHLGILDTMTTTAEDTELTEHQWHLLGEILCCQTYTVEGGERVWQVAGLQVDTGTLQDAVRACRERAGEAVGDVRLRGRETEGGE